LINGTRMHLSSISCLIVKGLNTYVNKVFLFFYFFNTFAKKWGIVSKLRILIYLINFRIRL
jgi:hypothetical protein